MIILICGFTASGKSYLSESLAKKLNYKFVHTSHILKLIHTNKDIDPNKTKMNKGWYEFSNLDSVRHKDLNLDYKLDNYLKKLVKEKDNLVLDSWTLPYISNNKKKIIKIWLHASPKVRTLRLMKRDKVSLEEAKKIIKKKDSFNKRHFKKIYGFVLGKDLDVFDHIINVEKDSVKEITSNIYELIKSRFK